MNGSYEDICQTVQVGLDVISVLLTQHSISSKVRTKFRRVDDVEKGLRTEPWGRL